MMRSSGQLALGAFNYIVLFGVLLAELAWAKPTAASAVVNYWRSLVGLETSKPASCKIRAGGLVLKIRRLWLWPFGLWPSFGRSGNANAPPRPRFRQVPGEFAVANLHCSRSCSAAARPGQNLYLGARCQNLYFLRLQISKCTMPRRELKHDMRFGPQAGI